MRITGYIYRADTYCPDCIIGQVRPRVGYGPFDYSLPVEKVLDQIAEANKLDRYDERTFDTDDFPKVIFGTDDDGEQCGNCGQELG